MALSHLVDLPLNIVQVVFCVDSLSVLSALNSVKSTTRSEIVLEIQHLIHFLYSKGTLVNFCWIPSHCGIYGNECCDRAAKRGAKQLNCSVKLDIPLSIEENYTLLHDTAWKKFLNETRPTTTKAFGRISLNCSRTVSNAIFRLKLDALKTKYVRHIKCACGRPFNINHMLLNCQQIRAFLPVNFREQNSTVKDLISTFSDASSMIAMTEGLLQSPVSNLI